MKASEIVSSKQATDWYSPGQANFNTPQAGIQTVNRFLVDGKLPFVGNTWLGGYVGANNDFVVREMGQQGKNLCFGLNATKRF